MIGHSFEPLVTLFLPHTFCDRYETATIMRALHMDEFLPPLILMDLNQGPASGGGRGGPASSLKGGPSAFQEDPPSRSNNNTLGGSGSGSLSLAALPLLNVGGMGGRKGTFLAPVTRKILRKGSRVLNLLKSMVGVSHKIYTQVRV